MESIDDNEELEYTEDAFNVLQFSPQEKFDCYMLTAGVMSCGGIEFITKGRDDQAECEAIGEEGDKKSGRSLNIFFQAQTRSRVRWPMRSR